MLRLQTFGGLTLSRGTENLTGAVTQRRRLAVLALLAVTGEPGVSRDKLQAYLWPESDADRARHVLNQLVYAQRRQVGTQSLFLGRKTLRLNPGVLWSDASALEQAFGAGDLETGVALYRGPFLDGFFLKDAPEFERWAEDQRARFARRVLAALAQLADRAVASGDHRLAAEWWRQAAGAAPYDTGVALGLVQTLAAAGDRAGALVAARRHEELLRRDLGMGPDPSFTEAVARLR
ncbi:MAG TPA: BTAD domain-containing putative transcriptional regulator [Gemmatimonadales bacterium]|jgi:serine/threonine-protein kinase|nr:BTAD domain-containing putative transcriptional regulator [Gemmatimonadales bacterium]